MNLGERLKKFIENTQDNSAAVADKIGISKSQLSSYLCNRKIPSAETLLKLYEFGMSIDWLLTGYGSMFNKSVQGKILHKSYYDLTTNQMKTPVDRIRYWIELNFRTIEYFSACINKDSEFIYQNLEDNQFIGQDFYSILEYYGCNFKWLSEGTGSLYAENESGDFLRICMEKRENNGSILDDGITETKMTFSQMIKISQFITKFLEINFNGDLK